jgi:hypothetical protein
VNVQGWDNDNLALRGLSVYVNGKFYTNLPGQFVGMIGVGTGYVQFYSRGVNKCNVFDGTLKLVLAGTV